MSGERSLESTLGDAMAAASTSLREKMCQAVMCMRGSALRALLRPLLIYCTPYSQPYCACWLNTFGAYLLCVAFVAVAGRRYTYTVCTYLLTYFAEHQVSKYRRELSAMRL